MKAFPSAANATVKSKKPNTKSKVDMPILYVSANIFCPSYFHFQCNI